MTTLTRKQREVQQREALILEVAQRLLLERGYFGLNMERIAEATEYSKGTIYHHFSCKEDIVAALTARTMGVRKSLFERAATFAGRPRERMTAIGVADMLFFTAYHEHFRMEQICKVEAVWDKATEDRRMEVILAEDGCFNAIMGIIRDAIAQGDLCLDSAAALPPEGIMFGLWSMAWGGRSLMTLGLADRKLNLEDAEGVLARNFQLYLDGCNWQPRSSEWDYRQTVERARDEVFADEWRKLHG
jgi:AcrR family transcriptional regulator